MKDVAHRLWPPPRSPWVMFQSWQQLLFAHWPVPLSELRPLVPPELELDDFDGSGWVSVTPFVLKGLRIRYLPHIPGADDFPEMNFRTYVRVGGVPGIWFFSLDAASRLAVSGARTFYRLPYKNARMHVRSIRGGIEYRSRRLDGRAVLQARYRPIGPSFHAAPGTLEYFLTERYALYVVLRDRTIIRGDIHHPPWDLQPAEATFVQNTVAEAEGVHLPDLPPLLHYSARQDTLVWPPKVVG
jgi:uncharacterized protein YqjF (DUF2071 family)